MLSVGPSSSCDVCFESFDANLKAPTAITCGHVFCNQCVFQFRAAQNNACPMCRTTYEFRNCAKLHIDAEGLTAEQKAGCTPEDLAQAAKIQKAISAVADEGITEPKLRQLIQEGRTFLHSQPRNLHKDLRIAHRMISYLCETKASLRAQTQLVESLRKKIEQLEEDYGAQIEKLNEEKEELAQDNDNLTKEQAKLRQSLADSESTREMERDTALAVEASLRAHIDRIRAETTAARDAYLGLVRRSNQLSTQYEELKTQLSQRTVSAGPYRDTYKSSNYIYSNSSSSVDLLNPLLDRTALQGVAMQDPKTPYLISPLPQFTSVLSDVALPELANDDEEDEDEDSEDDDEDGLSTPDSDQHEPPEYPSQLRPSATMPPPLRSALKGGSYEPSGLSRTAPFTEHQRRARSSSNPIEHLSRSHSPHASSAGSTPPTSPPNDATRTAHSYDQYPSGSSYGSFPQASSSAQSQYQANRGQPIPYGRNPHPEGSVSSTPLSSSPHRVQADEQLSSRYTPSSLTSTPQPNAYHGQQPRSAATDQRSSAPQLVNNNNLFDLARLQNILSDAPISVSMPAMNQGRHFPSPFSSTSTASRNDTTTNREPRPSPPLRTDSSNSYTKTPTQGSYVKASTTQQQPQSTSDDLSHLLASSSSYQTSSAYVPSTSPNLQKMSTASAHAQKLEDERRRKHEEEKRRRQEEDQKKWQEAERYQAEEGRYQEPLPKYTSASASAAAAAAAAAATLNAKSGQAARKDPQLQHSTSTSRRGQQPNALSTVNSYPRGYDQGVYS